MTDGIFLRWRIPLASLSVAAGTLALMILTGPRLAIAWDEGYTLGREARLRSWFRAVVDPPRFAATWTPPTAAVEMVKDKPPIAPPRRDEVDSRAKLFSPRMMAWFWPFAREEPHGHPPFYALVGLLGDIVAPTWAALPRARLGPMIAFSLCAGAIFAAVGGRWGAWPASLAAGAWVFHPQLFAQGHYATYDAILSALWVGATLAFARAVESGPEPRRPAFRWVVVFGVLCGWAACTKLTGWFLPIPLMAWSLLARSRKGLWTIGLGGAIAILTLYVFNPPWWVDPIGGPIRFFRSNLSRGETIPIPVLFLGRVYNTPVDSLPWYNTLAWTAMATPVGFLALAVAGAVKAIRDARSPDPLPILALAQWATLLALRALPHTPGHDGVRQFLPAFGGLALVAGVGAAWAVQEWGRWGKTIVAAALIEGVLSVAVMMPVPLSYFSPVVGGLPGATRLGMEPTYYWDALTDDALARLDRRVPPGAGVRFATYPTSWIDLRDRGQIRTEWWPSPLGTGQYRLLSRPAVYVVQNRPGAFRDYDRALAARYGADRRFILSEKLGVPLVWAFPYDLLEAELGRGGGPP